LKITATSAVIFLVAMITVAGVKSLSAAPPKAEYLYVSISLFNVDKATVKTKSGVWPKPGMAAANTMDLAHNPMPLESEVLPFAFYLPGKDKKHPGKWKECKVNRFTVADSMGPALRRLARKGTMTVIKNGKKVKVPYYRLDLYYKGKVPPKELAEINKKICKVRVYK